MNPISGTLLELTQARSRAPGQPASELQKLIQSFKVGQLLNAIVIRVPSRGSLSLNIAGYEITARSEVSAAPGTPLKLEVTKAGTQPTLRVTDPIKTHHVADKVIQGLRHNLPRQQPVRMIMDRLMSIVVSANTETPNKATLLLAPLARQVLSVLPSRQQVSTAKGLRHAIRHSGLFMESALSQTTTRKTPLSPIHSPLRRDLKHALLKLFRDLKQQLPKPPAGNATTKAKGSLAATATPSLSGRPTPPQTTLPPAPPTALTSTASSKGTTLRHDQATTSSASPLAPLTSTRPRPEISLKQLFIQEVVRQQAAKSASVTRNTPASRQLAELIALTEGALARIQTRQLAPISAHGAEDRVQPSWSLELPVRDGKQIDDFALLVQKDPDASVATGESGWSVVLKFDIGDLGPITARVSLDDDQVSTVFWPSSEPSRSRLQHKLEHLKTRFEKAGLSVGHLDCRIDAPPSVDLIAPADQMLDERA